MAWSRPGKTLAMTSRICLHANKASGIFCPLGTGWKTQEVGLKFALQLPADCIKKCSRMAHTNKARCYSSGPHRLVPALMKLDAGDLSTQKSEQHLPGNIFKRGRIIWVCDVSEGATGWCIRMRQQLPRRRDMNTSASLCQQTNQVDVSRHGDQIKKQR